MSKTVNGKKKGNSFERKIANLFSARFENITGIKNSFRRSFDSGSFFGRSNQKRLNTHDKDHANFGDILCPSNFNFSLECKHYKTPPSLQSILNHDCKEWDNWIAQAKQDSANAGKNMLLIIKYNRIDEFVVVDKEITGAYYTKYKEYFIVALDVFLNQSDDVFFSSCGNEQ